MSGHRQTAQGPAPPLVQTLLRQALQFKKRLDANPGMTQADLAEELGISRVRVTQILNLLRLAPEIQERILSMPPATAKRAVVSENRLRNLVGIRDQALQVRNFMSLLDPTATAEDIA